MTLRRSLLVGVLLLCFGATGCGRAGDRAEVTEVVEQFFAAVASGDGATACAQLDADTRKMLETDERKACRDAIAGLRVEAGSLTGIELYLTNAKADLDNGESALLSSTVDGWRVSAAGCAPGEGPPDDAPMECELEA